jgi:hypothetical protein
MDDHATRTCAARRWNLRELLRNAQQAVRRDYNAAA